MGEVVNIAPHSAPTDLSAMAMERAGHVVAIRAIDNAFAAAIEERAAALEEICQIVCATSLALPSLPPGVLEESRQTAERLPGFIRRVVRLMNPGAGA